MKDIDWVFDIEEEEIVEKRICFSNRNYGEFTKSVGYYYEVVDTTKDYKVYNLWYDDGYLIFSKHVFPVFFRTSIN